MKSMLVCDDLIFTSNKYKHVKKNQVRYVKRV